ncbi:MAG: dipeptide/oligopeptide/nickel ABC transporter permease/ATP-binding protein [Trebonia sp.]
MTRRLARDPRAWFAGIVFAVVAVVAVFAPLIAPEPRNWSDISLSMSGPSAHHLLGLDRGGNDILSRLIYATPTSLLGMLIAVVVALVIGIPAGLTAGFYKGSWFDSAADWLVNLLMAIPAIVVLLVVSGIAGPSLWITMGVFGVLLSTAVFRVVQAAVNGVRTELYVDAAKVNGLSMPAIIGSHIFRVIRGPVIVLAAFLGGIGIAIQAGLQFLGVGSSDTPTWGGMLNTGFGEIYTAPLQMLWPVLAIGLMSAACVLAGNALTDAFGRPEPRAPSRRRLRATAKAHRASGTGPAAGRTSAGVRPAGAGAALTIRGLHVGYRAAHSRVEVVHGVDLDLGRGRVLGLVGESGSGKTQVVLATLGLLPAGGAVTGGSIDLTGTCVTSMSASERRKLLGCRIGYIPQDPLVNLDPSFRVGYQLTEPLRSILKLSRAAARDRALELLARVGISEPERVLRAYPHQISGGMAQRVLIAGAIACEPEILVADEPTTALDVTVQAEVLDLLRGLQAEREMSMLVVTHNFGVVSDLCDDVAVMRRGEIVERGDVRTVLRSPRHEYTKELLAAMVEDKEPLVTDAGQAATEAEKPLAEEETLDA